ncbi:alpha/beta hydrolase-fold protein [Pseudonocardia abyssalis]|nr:alpha/beta hydrolase-fold protein [Pseudonocardia abyssalis]
MPSCTGRGYPHLPDPKVPQCPHSLLGRAETYLAVDVPAWVGQHLQVDPVRRAIGGFSFGGTCAVQLAVHRPDVYPTFLDVSGRSEPTLGDRASTVARALGGDDDAFRRAAPLDELASGSRPGSAGVFAVGTTTRTISRRPNRSPRRRGIAVTAVTIGVRDGLSTRRRPRPPDRLPPVIVVRERGAGSGAQPVPSR